MYAMYRYLLHWHRKKHGQYLSEKLSLEMFCGDKDFLLLTRCARFGIVELN